MLLLLLLLLLLLFESETEVCVDIVNYGLVLQY